MEIIIAIIGTASAVVTLCLTNYFSKKNQLRYDEKKLKEEHYLKLINALSDNVLSDNEEEAKTMLSNTHNHILLIGSSDVVVKLRNFSKLISIDNKNGFSHDEHDILLTELIKSIRYDLYKNNKINKNYPIISLSGKRKRHKE